MKKQICKNCGVEFIATNKTGLSLYCSDTCRNIVGKIVNEKHRKKKYEEIYKDLKENEDYVVCKWCGQKVKQIYGNHIRCSHAGKTSADYKKEFPGAMLSSLKHQQIPVFNGGKHMKEEKWRKWASEKSKGENNRNHKSKTTEQQRKERSPFSKEFYKKHGLTEDDLHNFTKNVAKNRVSDTTLQYYLNKGYNEEQSKILLKDRQTTFSLEKCIKKHGQEEGLRRWKERQEKWKEKVFNSNQWIGKGTSALNIEIIDKILCYNTNNEKLLHNENEKYIYDSNNKCAFKYDLTNISNKKIIEINGTYWHCKPSIYDANYYNKVKKCYAKDIWEYDKRKINIAKKHGYDVLIIWEDDYRKDPEKIIKVCVDFIYENNN